MLDAYERQYIPEHMLTREFLTEVRSLLTPDGVVAANTFSSSRLYQNESVTYRSVFGPFYNLKSGNRVILAANGALPPIEARDAQQPALHRAHSRRSDSRPTRCWSASARGWIGIRTPAC